MGSGPMGPHLHMVAKQALVNLPPVAVKPSLYARTLRPHPRLHQLCRAGCQLLRLQHQRMPALL